MPSSPRILLFGDSHLGLDLPSRPRVPRRRRGHDFLANHAAALQPARSGEVDLVVHAGDLFDRPDVPASLAYQAYEPLIRVADRGVPVFIVPGNHERSRLPHRRFGSHEGVRVFDRPRTFTVDVRGARLALSGFPYERRGVRARFRDLLERTGWRRERADVRVLCLHHCVEGATVGPGDFVFRGADDVVRLADIPEAFSAVFSGHIHRHQVLITDLRGRAIRTPVLYPGSIERTSFAEIGEPKGFLIVRFDLGAPRARPRWDFRRLPARPMLRKELCADAWTGAALDTAIRAIVAAAPPDAVLGIRVAGAVSPAGLRALSAARLRSFVPETMNLDVTVAGDRRGGPPGRRPVRPSHAGPSPARPGARVPAPQLDLGLPGPRGQA